MRKHNRDKNSHKPQKNIYSITYKQLNLIGTLTESIKKLTS